MNKDQRKKWYRDTVTLNQNHTLRIGDEISDIKGNVGKVTSIIEGTSPEDHGFIEVKLKNNMIEHYVHFEWYKHIRVIHPKT